MAVAGDRVCSVTGTLTQDKEDIQQAGRLEGA